ncbi:ribosome maturation factor RimP [Corynebacterium sp. 320]|uniref:ribosome maturation factor RimP n=1 Tax=Corynebacterium TaxID=1716 RepID=UPI00125CCF53|nr:MULTISPECIES: ribosome maturation factor RimP [Corynebacterium]KAB1503790.1 ribosome maturation factor RimP [Corynebacterium sp. 320]KAB1553110.1 ribosome maturation factor RimP [Corynebacterium sp. 321]KAB1553672.1 ribosome maturation factor RimP [Corynebacterium sp. 319]KAB3527926.1 ribosome maturation factor RimP [Corynebacterium sp. 250]KAB3540585.1 ribosome maturation factor RimP [Corynebacterium sp. 366]
MAFPSKEQVQSFLHPVIAEFGVELEDVEVAKAGAKSRVKVLVDAPDLDAVEEISKSVSESFDAAEERGELNFGPGYTLEVSTPGLDFPLTAERHWRKNIGRLVRLKDGRKVRIAQVDGENVILIAAQKKNLDVFRQQLAEVAGAVVEVEFNAVPQQEAQLVGLDVDAYNF